MTVFCRCLRAAGRALHGPRSTMAIAHFATMSLGVAETAQATTIDPGSRVRNINTASERNCSAQVVNLEAKSREVQRRRVA